MATRSTNWTIVLGLFGFSNLANGVWMLAAPAHWYFNLPADIPGTGPLNEHMVRDIGCIFLLMGVGLCLGALRPALRLPALAVATGWSGLHALVHVFDTVRGLLAPGHWAIDVPGIYGPTTLLLLVTGVAWRTEKRRARA